MSPFKEYNMKSIITKATLILGVSLLYQSCNLLDITPKHVVPTEIAFNDVDSYEMALNNVFRTLTSSVMNMHTTDFASDDFSVVLPGYAPTNYYIYNWDYQSQPQPLVWVYQYQLIAKENVLIDNYPLVPALDETEENRIQNIYAQALGLRAWSLFNLVQLYGSHPNDNNKDELSIILKLKLELEYLPQSSLREVYSQIYSDLDNAESILLENDDLSTYKPTYQFGLNAVRALKARVALFEGDYEKAAKASEYFINTPLLDKENYWMLWEDHFIDANNEIIFMTHNLSDTDDASLIDYHEIYITNSVRLNDDLINSYEAGDIRKTLDYISTDQLPSKFIININDRNSQINRNVNYKHFRLAEQYLIYAESVLSLNPNEALRVLNIVKEKRGASPLTTFPTISDIIEERRRELFTEGLRFYDLKRLSNQLNITITRSTGEVLAPNSPSYTWDIPRDEINSNPHIN